MFQQITLVGHLGNDPEMRSLPDGTPVANFSLAVNMRRKGEDVTLWLRVTAWRRTAETVSQYLSKGSKVLVVGELEQPRIYEVNGEQRVSLDITAQTVRFMDSKGDSQQGPIVHGGQGASESMTDEDIPF